MARRWGFQVIRAGGVGILATLVIAVACGRAQEPAQTATLIMGPAVSGSDMALLRDGLTVAQYGDWTRVRGARASAVATSPNSPWVSATILRAEFETRCSGVLSG